MITNVIKTFDDVIVYTTLLLVMLTLHLTAEQWTAIVTARCLCFISDAILTFIAVSGKAVG